MRFDIKTGQLATQNDTEEFYHRRRLLLFLLRQVSQVRVYGKDQYRLIIISLNLFM
jgi:hypothetical protein